MINTDYTLDQINKMSFGNMGEHLGIEFMEINSEYIIAKMPVDHRTRQPFGLLHGGASVVLAETLGSVASWLSLDDPQTQSAVGVEINANHLKAVKSGFVYGKCQAIRVGKSLQVWEIRITNEKNDLICISRLTVAVVKKH